jgi:hypothetical protein
MGQVAIISTGDPEKDREQIERSELFVARTDEGLCPNGCAELEWETQFSADCPVCHFHLGTNVPYGKREVEGVM